ncbi:MAG: DMT family transporter [Burkholderiaceae bacterium]|nr:DMT family transporter [Burkholderiaceae bacterium]
MSTPATSPETLSEPSAAPDARQRAALLLALGLILVWGANFSVQKAVFTALSPGGFLFARYLIMPLCAVALLWQRYGRRWPRLARDEWWALARLALLGHVLHVGLVTFGIHWSTAFSSSLILACGPVFTLLILRFAGTERLTRAQIAGVAVACAGVLVFLSDKLLGAQWRASGGDLVLLVAAAFFSAYTVAAKPVFERHGGVLVMAYTTLIGAVPLVLLSAPAGLAVDWTAVTPAIWAGLLWAVIVSAFVGWIVWGWVNGVRGVARTAPLLYLMPPVAGVVAWLATGEGYTLIKLAGAAVTLGGVALAQFAPREKRAAPPESVTVVD